MVTAIQSYLNSDQWVEHMRREYKREIEKAGGVWRCPKYQLMFRRAMKDMIPHTGLEQLPWEITLINASKGNAWSKATGKIAVYRSYIELLVMVKKLQGVLENHPALAKKIADPELRQISQQTIELSEYGQIRLEDIFAYIVGHEMGHVILDHFSPERILMNMVLFNLWPLFSAISTFAFYSYFSNIHLVAILIPMCAPYLISKLIYFWLKRMDEFEADQKGMQLMTLGGYNPKAALWEEHSGHIIHNTSWFGWLKNWFEEHPLCIERLKANKITLETLNIDRSRTSNTTAAA